MTGDNWSSMATCPRNANHQASIVVTDGKVDEAELRYKDEGGDDPDAEAGD